VRAHQRSILERNLRLDDNNATGSPFETPDAKCEEALDALLEREHKLGLPEGWQSEFFPKVMPVAWTPVVRESYVEKWRRNDGLTVIISAAVELDDKRWLHVSCSRTNTLPSWKDLKEVKRVFVGRDRPALQLLPAEANYVNLHPYVLHLYSCIDNDAIPDFTHGTGKI
jgi:hypothetical protein